MIAFLLFFIITFLSGYILPIGIYFTAAYLKLFADFMAGSQYQQKSMLALLTALLSMAILLFRWGLLLYLWGLGFSFCFSLADVYLGNDWYAVGYVFTLLWYVIRVAGIEAALLSSKVSKQGYTPPKGIQIIQNLTQSNTKNTPQQAVTLYMRIYASLTLLYGLAFAIFPILRSPFAWALGWI